MVGKDSSNAIAYSSEHQVVKTGLYYELQDSYGNTFIFEESEIIPIIKLLCQTHEKSNSKETN